MDDKPSYALQSLFKGISMAGLPSLETFAENPKFMRKPVGFLLAAFAFAVLLSGCTVGIAPTIELSGPCTILRFDGPATITNEGSKLTVEKIANPDTNRWEPVWGDHMWKETWVASSLQFDGPSDDVHNGGKLKILKPVTIAVSVFGDGQTTALTTRMPSAQRVFPRKPVTHSKVTQL